MANSQSTIVVSLLLFSLAFHSASAYIDEKHPLKVLPERKVVVEGIVYCQSCKELGTSSLSGAKPIPLARVSVTCKDQENRVFHCKEYTTNEYGYFYADLAVFSKTYPKKGIFSESLYLFGRPHRFCKVKLVSSPMENCNVPTEINSEINGASLRRENRRQTKKDCYHEFFAAGPLAFRPAQCNSDNNNY